MLQIESVQCLLSPKQPDIFTLWKPPLQRGICSEFRELYNEVWDILNSERFRGNFEIKSYISLPWETIKKLPHHISELVIIYKDENFYENITSLKQFAKKRPKNIKILLPSMANLLKFNELLHYIEATEPQKVEIVMNKWPEVYWEPVGILLNALHKKTFPISQLYVVDEEIDLRGEIKPIGCRIPENKIECHDWTSVIWLQETKQLFPLACDTIKIQFEIDPNNFACSQSALLMFHWVFLQIKLVREKWLKEDRKIIKECVFTMHNILKEDAKDFLYIDQNSIGEVYYDWDAEITYFSLSTQLLTLDYFDLSYEVSEIHLLKSMNNQIRIRLNCKVRPETFLIHQIERNLSLFDLHIIEYFKIDLRDIDNDEDHQTVLMKIFKICTINKLEILTCSRKNPKSLLRSCDLSTGINLIEVRYFTHMYTIGSINFYLEEFPYTEEPNQYRITTKKHLKY